MQPGSVLRRSPVALATVALLSCSAAVEPLSAIDVAESGDIDAKWDDATGVVVVTNSSPGRIELVNELFVERREDIAWEEHTSLHALRGAAEREITIVPCLVLAPGESLRAAPWDRTIGRHGSCMVRDAPPGTYRIVLHRCEGTQRFRGAPFVL
jgi:hypothetical protein